MIAHTHSLSLALASVMVSIVASTTALALMKDLSTLPESKRKTLIVMSAFVLGGGIWSMHFIAMLSLEFPVPVQYDMLRTLSSGLIAVLVVGFALLLLHFRERTRRVLNAAGVTLGAGIVSMHFVGMLGMQGILAQFSTLAIVAATALAMLTGIAAVRVSYTIRSRQNIVKGGVIFGLSVAAVHYVAMIGTHFAIDPAYQVAGIALDPATLGIVLTIAAFCICGAFLLAASTFVPAASPGLNVAPPTPEPPDADLPSEPQADSAVPGRPEPTVRIPYEQNKQVQFVMSDEVGALRADGRYTQVHTRDGVKFCPWSISEAEKRLEPAGFYRAHRSYLVNVGAVAGFTKSRDAGVCRFEGFSELEDVPVSRTRVGDLAAELGL